jgi:hypothetical protein
METTPMIVILLLSAGLVIACVVFHGFVLHLISIWLYRRKSFGFYRVSIFIFYAILAHLIEIVFFQLAYFWLVSNPGQGPHYGSISGADELGWQDLFYFSAATYTTTGYGDLTPTENLRLLATVEALTGLIMVTWTASFAFLLMQRIWKQKFQDKMSE